MSDFRCAPCELTFQNQQQLDGHHRRYHLPRPAQPAPPRAVARASAPASPTSSATPPEVRCEPCRLVFQDQQELDSHRRRRHSPAPAPSPDGLPGHAPIRGIEDFAGAVQGWLDALGIAVVDRTKVGGTDALVGGNYLTLIDPSIRPTRLAMLERAQGVAVGRGVQHVIVFTLAGVADAAAKFVIDADVAVFEVGYDGSATAASPRAQRLATQAWRSGERAASTPAKPPAGPCCDWCEEEAELSALTEVEGQLLCGDCLDQGLWDEEIHRCPLCDTVVAKLVTVRHTKSRHEITSCRACVGSKAARRALATEVSAGGRPCAQCKRMFFSPLLSRDHPDEPNEWCRDCIDTSFDVCDHCGDRTADGTVFTRGSVSVLVCEDCSPAAGQILHDAVLDAINDPDEEFWDDEPSDDADDEDLDLSWDLLDDP